uniref:Glycophorin-A n=1 Tax=Panagrellus redivivus TaxID=6233 RepID=A0A7E4VXF5_PANRE
MRGYRWILGVMLIGASFVASVAESSTSDAVDLLTTTDKGHTPNATTTIKPTKTTTASESSSIPTTDSTDYQLSKDRANQLKIRRPKKKHIFGAFEIVAIIGAVINIFIVGLGFILGDLYYDRIFGRFFIHKGDNTNKKGSDSTTTDEKNIFSKTLDQSKTKEESVDKA